MDRTPLVQLDNIVMKFGKHTVHDGISLNIFPDEVVTLLGPSGTGKTVLLKIIIGLLFPTSGSVNVMGKNLSKLNEEELRQVRRNIGMLFQGAALFDSLSVFDNIAFPLREFKVPEEQIAKIVDEKLSWVNLQHKAQKFPTELSGGQKKRIGLARALATSPKMVLFDEPTTGLDPTSKGDIDELIVRLRDELNITSVVVTHDIESAKKFSDRLILLSNGKVTVDGRASDLWRENQYVTAFAEGRWEEA